MIIKFVSQAHAELTDAVAYYEGELSGLGYRFWEEVDEHVSWIEANHEVPQLRPLGFSPVRTSNSIVEDCILFGAADPCKVRVVDVGGHLVHAHAGMAMLERADIQPDQIEQLFLL